MANYDIKTDYSDLIKAAAAKGDYAAAALYEQQRNAKIAGEGMSFSPTNEYSQYLTQPQTPAQPAVKPVETTYTDANGNTQKGYIVNGKTYTDAQAQSRVPVGSVVDVGETKYIMTDNGGQLYSDYLAQQQAQQKPQTQDTTLAQLNAALAQLQTTYQQQTAAGNASQAAATQKAIMQLQAQKDALDAEYQQLYKQLYIDRMMSEKKVPQQLAAMGYTGGLAESSLIGIQNEYANALQQGESARLKGLYDLDNAMTDAQLTGDIAAADAARADAQNYYTNYLQLISAIGDENRYAEAQKEQEAEAARALAQSQVDAMIGRGETPNAELKELSGYDEQYISGTAAYYAAQLAAQQAAEQAASGGSYSGGSKSAAPEEAEMDEDIPNGELSERAQRALEFTKRLQKNGTAAAEIVQYLLAYTNYDDGEGHSNYKQGNMSPAEMQYIRDQLKI